MCVCVCVCVCVSPKLYMYIFLYIRNYISIYLWTFEIIYVYISIHSKILAHWLQSAVLRTLRWSQTHRYCTGVGSGGGGGQGGHVPPHFFDWGGQWYFCAPPLLTPHFYFPLELYVYITLTNNYLAFFTYQLIILWTISIN